ncbi:MAG: TonB-dependent receptor [Pseudohongiella sp.]|nr:TonB-dependent receptor [Pseudohongiella sp.]
MRLSGFQLALFWVCWQMALTPVLSGSLHADAAALMTQQQQWQLAPLPLADALDIFSRDTGIQIVFRPEQVADKQAPELLGLLSHQQALDQLLDGTGLVWIRAGERVLAVRQPSQSLAGLPAAVEQTQTEVNSRAAVEPNRLPVITTVRVASATLRRSRSALGLERPLYEMPRAVSVTSRDQLDAGDVSGIDDLVKVVPGVYTLARFGVQGAADIRNATADVYFRGMRRVNQEGHVPSVLGVVDRIEIVRGPPSPLIGMGKPGGYTDIYPRTSLAVQPGASEAFGGFAELRSGRFNQAIASAGFGGPLLLAGRNGQFFVSSMSENSDQHIEGADIQNRVLQTALELDDLLPGYRLETGFYAQQSQTAGALVNRATQSLVSDGLYLAGSPLVNLDLNGNGQIGFLEMHQGSPVSGALSAGNQPLIQYWAWPRDANNQPLPLSAFPRISSIPASFYNYLQANPALDPDQLLRSRGIGGVVPASGWVPAGFALSPADVAQVPFDRRKAGAFEREIGADSLLMYMDVLPSTDNPMGFRNQLFVDVLDQYKLSEQPGGGKQDVRIVENRLSKHLLSWKSRRVLQLDLHATTNLRYTQATGYRYGGDHGNHRIDASALPPQGDANSRFVHAFDNNNVNQDGAPWISRYRSRYREHGGGLMLDMMWEEHSNLLLGLRYDYSKAANTDVAGTVDINQGTSSAPGRLRVNDQRSTGYDDGVSWHVSYSFLPAKNWRAYLTRSRTSMTLEDINNRLDNRVIDTGHIEDTDLTEFGIRYMSPQNNRTFSLLSFSQQFNNQNQAGFQTLPSYLTSFATQGWEIEVAAELGQSLDITAYGLRHVTHIKGSSDSLILVDARTLGFQDVLDRQGNLVYPAEAFLYGGRSFLRLPEDVEGFDVRQGYPRYQAGLLLRWQWQPDLALNASLNHFSSTYSGRLKQIRLPSEQIAGIGLDHVNGPWRFRVNVNNLFDRTWLRARSRDSLGETLLTVMPGRTWQFMVRYTID